ncbi:glycosyl hydrolase family 8 [uncultured Tenacibaculum sp.]|uniref:glycosyl hydrolase family 8 n=1 Tax=uncultured Tenacibaculum sp. TaxID=174713 RepID=UPI0026032862|nr:glycosyl hydrolase family 8 [uncultured Tenacibaculum sp.]
MRKITLLLLFCVVSIVAQNSNIQFSNTTYPFGSMPSNVQEADLKDAYVQWKANFATTCTGGRARIKFDDPNFTVSEGIAYGMLLSAYANDKELFDGLWKYYKSHTNANGVMNWKIEGCDTVNGQNGATDAELDAAIALIIAGNRFGNTGILNYHQEAKDLIAIMKQHEIEATSYVLKPGDAWGGSNNTNPSYFAPAYFRVYGKFTNDVQFWDNVTAKTYEILNANLSVNNAVDCLVSDWCKADGSYSDIVPWAFNSGKSFYYDAARTPWRIATDYIWFGKTDASSYLAKCENFVSRVGGLDNITAGYNQDGTQIHTFKDPTYTGSFAASLMNSNQTVVDNAYSTTKNLTSTAYFATTLRVIYMFTLSGNFYNPVSEVLSNEEVVQQQKDIIIYPNPTTNELRLVNFELGKKVKIYNTLGKEIMTTDVKNSNMELVDVSELPTGIYFINSGKVKIKFIKK